MTIKSLLLGSAASLVAVSGAQAADAIIIEPEPVEYVRVCDAYGAGFYYIPGTETCLSINGYVRFQLGFSTDDDAANNGLYGFEDDTYNASVRGRLNFDARSETEFGTLRSYLRIQGDLAPDLDSTIGEDGNVDMEAAYIQLGGLVMGYRGSFYSVDGMSDVYGDDTMNDGSGSDTILVGYTYAANGLAIGISVEDDDTNDFAPDVVGYVSYGWDAFGLFAAVAYDEEVTVTDDDGWAAKIGATYATDRFGFKLIGLYADSGNAHAPGTGDGELGDLGGTAFGGGAEWSVIASMEYAATDNLTLALSGQYFWDFYEVADPFDGTGVDGYQVEAAMIWEPVENFSILTGVAYRDLVDEPDGADDGELEGVIRFTRSF
ncbi:porin [Notoacmeibacter marinus]|nr:porin [Notoacmeibacter marinus]